jgi:hypothetical protein
MTYYAPMLAYEILGDKIKKGTNLSRLRVPLYDKKTKEYSSNVNLFRGDTGFLNAYEGKVYGTSIDKNDEYTKKLYDYLVEVELDMNKKKKRDSNIKKIQKLIDSGKKIESKIKAIEFTVAEAESKDDLTKNKSYFINKTAKNLIEELVEYYSNNEVSKAENNKITKVVEAYNMKMREFKKI